VCGGGGRSCSVLEEEDQSIFILLGYIESAHSCPSPDMSEEIRLNKLSQVLLTSL
jgi:hypothetical protein